MSEKFKPLADRILVRRQEAEEVTSGGIIIPDTAKEKPIKGEVLAVGPGSVMDDGKRAPMDVQIGDVVLFGKWSGTEIKFDNQEDLLVIKVSDVLGTIYK